MNFLQSENWFNLKTALGNKCVWVKDLFFIISKTPILNKGIGYMPRVDITKIDLKDLITKAKENNLIFVTIDPLNLKSNINSIDFFKSKNVKVSKGFSIHLPKTVMIDLLKDESQLLSDMKQKTRYNIKLSNKKNLTIKFSNQDKDLLEFLKLYTDTFNRQKYFGRSESYLKKVWDNFKVTDSVFIATVEYNSTAIVSWFIIKSGDTLTYVYGGSNEEYKNLMAPYFLTWELIKYGKENGFKYLDLFGIKDDLSDGYSRFKIGFGGEIVEFADTVDLIINPLMYKLIKLVYTIRNKILFRS